MSEAASPRPGRAFVESEEVQVVLSLHDDRVKRGGGLVLLEGPRGVGKGSILAQVRSDLAARGRLVLFGRAERTGTRAYAALVEPVAQAMAFLESRGLAESFLETHTHALSVLLPRLAPGGPPARARDKVGFFESLRAFFIDLAHHTPLTILLLDLHYGDEDTRDLVRFLCQHLFAPERTVGAADDGFNGVLIAASRTDDEDGALLVQSLAKSPDVARHEIGGLNKETLLRYLKDHPAVDRLLHSSKGRPDDVDELLSAIPENAEALFAVRLEQQTPLARRILQALATVGTPATVDLLADILEEGAAQVANALSTLVRDRILVRRLKTGELLFAFRRTHDLETVVRNADPTDKKTLHHRVAEALSARDPDSERQRIALHYLRGHTPAAGTPHALEACAELLMTFSYGAAAALAERALPYAEGEDRFVLLGHLVGARRLKGDLRGAQEAAEDWIAACPPGEKARVLREVGDLFDKAGDRKDALRVLEQALLVAQQDQVESRDGIPESALILSTMGRALYADGDLARTAQLADDALAQTPDTAPPAFLWELKNLRAKVAYLHGDLPKAEQMFLRNLDFADHEALKEQATQSRINVGLCRLHSGNVAEALDVMRAALVDARATGNIRIQAGALVNLAVCEQRICRWGDAVTHFLSALSLFSRLGNRKEVRRTAWNLANLFCALGDRDRARLYLDQSRRISEADDSDRGRAFVCFTEGDLALDDGQVGAAISSYEKARALFASLNEKKRVGEMTIKSAWASIELRDLATAKARLADLDDFSDDEMFTARKNALAGALLALGESPAPAQTPAEGLGLLAQAVDTFERAHANEDLLRALLFIAARYAEMGDERSAVSARDRARHVVDEISSHLTGDLAEQFTNHPLTLKLRQSDVAPHPAPEEPSAVDDDLAIRRGPDRRTDEWNERYGRLIGHSPALLRVFERLDRITRSHQPTVLVRGESGTGKELVAAAIHHLGERKEGPFIRVNCAALVETLLLSELFGHEKGSFTGAFARKIGRFELARGGTIFLDEIGDISPKTQVSLLRVLQERSFERVGGGTTIKTDAAVICATHRDLEQMVAEGTFREDLYYRLRGVVIEVPPLRERPQDIAPLVHHFLSLAHDELGRAPTNLTPEAERVLTRYAWPGNIRELQNVVRSVALFCEDDTVDVAHLREFPELFEGRPVVIKGGDRADHTPATASAAVLDKVREQASAEGMALGDLKRKLEFEAIADAVRQTGGNITRAAKLLKMKRPRLSQIVNSDPELKRIKDASRATR